MTNIIHIEKYLTLHCCEIIFQICGINMRTATEDMAAKFLRQTGNTLSLLVQYNPEGEKSHLTEKINQRPLISIDLILYLTLCECLFD